jgi:ribosomal protein S17E
MNLKTNNNSNSAPFQQQNQQQLGQQPNHRITSPILQNYQHNRRLTCAQSVRNETKTSTENHETETLTTILTSFLNQFKEMFNQLLSQNSMILNMLTTVVSKRVH